MALATAACGGSSGSSTSSTSSTAAPHEECRADAGAQVCLTPNNGSTTYTMAATGFRPNSDITIVLAGPKVPTTKAGAVPPPARVDAQGKFPPANGGSGVIVPRGSGMVTVTVTGSAASGQAVRLAVTVEN